MSFFIFGSKRSRSRRIGDRALQAIFVSTLGALSACGGGGGSQVNLNSGSVVVINGVTNDAVYEPKRGLLYLGVSAAAGTLGNAITAVDPSTGKVVASQFAGSEPEALAVSDDGQFLYAALNGENRIQRFTLPSLTPDISFPFGSDSTMGPYVVMGLQVAPGKPHTIAVTLGAPSLILSSDYSTAGGLFIFDDAVARPQSVPYFNGLTGVGSGFAWDKGGAKIYAGDPGSSGNLFVVSVDDSGARLAQQITGAFNDYPGYIHYDSAGNRIYTDAGQVMDLSTGVVTKAFDSHGVMALDSDGQTAYFALIDGSDYQISEFDVATHQPVGAVPLVVEPALARRMISTGPRRVALLTNDGLARLVGVGGSGTTTTDAVAGDVPAGKFTESLIPTAANDLAWDSSHQLFYVAVPSTDSVTPSTIAAIDPVSGQVMASQATADIPNVLAISDDNQYLYVSEWSYEAEGTIERFSLPALVPDIAYALGTDSFLGKLEGWDIQVAPGAPHTLALTTYPGQGGGFGKVLIYDDATPRPDFAGSTNDVGSWFNSLQWGQDTSTLYAFDFVASDFRFSSLAVNSQGPALGPTYPYAENPNDDTYNARIHYDRSTGLIYEDSGMVLDPVNLLPKGLMFDDGPMTIDAKLGKAFFLQPNFLNSYDLDRYTRQQYISINPVSPTNRPLRLLRWNDDGLAFVSTDGVHLIRGDFVSGSTGTAAPAETPAPLLRPRAQWAKTAAAQRFSAPNAPGLER